MSDNTIILSETHVDMTAIASYNINEHGIFSPTHSNKVKLEKKPFAFHVFKWILTTYLCLYAKSISTYRLQNTYITFKSIKKQIEHIQRL